MNNEECIAVMKQRLTDRFQPNHLEIQDESHFHIGHAGAADGAGHFALSISSEKFNDKSLVICHRLIYETLSDLMTKKIHALKIKVIY